MHNVRVIIRKREAGRNRKAVQAFYEQNKGSFRFSEEHGGILCKEQPNGETDIFCDFFTLRFKNEETENLFRLTFLHANDITHWDSPPWITEATPKILIDTHGKISFS